jgi:hypothetical protein
MKKAANFILLFFTVISLFSQNYQFTWQQCFGGSEPDIAKDIVEVPGAILSLEQPNQMMGIFHITMGYQMGG